MKKIIADKEDGIAEIIDRILNEQDDEVTLVVPKNSALIRSVSNFRLLKREADTAGKDVAVESVDDTVLAFAKECGIQAIHPLWRGTRSEGEAGGMSDIVPKSRDPQFRPALKKKPLHEPAAIREEDEEVEMEYTEEEEEAAAPARPAKRLPVIAAAEEGDEEESTEEERPKLFGSRPFFSNAPTRSFGNGGGRRDTRDDDDDDDDDNGPKRHIAGKVWMIIIIVLVLVGLGAYVASAFFNHANVSITFKKTPWSWDGNLTVDKTVAADDLAGGVLAGQVFTANKNITDTFKASGESDVSLKATGMITIYNDYSTKSQELVATTRFETPAGQIFRITQDVTVPGATQGSGGALQPSSITAPIVADQPGPAYNIGPVAKLTIPGFQNDPQYNDFWGVINASTTGGFTGERAVPTAADVTAAEASTTADLQASLQGGFTGSYPNNFKILDGATQIQVGKLSVNTTTDANGNFTVYATATLAAIGFDESALKDALLEQAQATDASSTFSDINLNYSDVTPNLAKGQVAFALTAQGDLEPAFSTVDFEQQILGQDVSAARTTIAALPQLESAEISVWPAWLSTIPTDPAKVHISVQ